MTLFNDLNDFNPQDQELLNNLAQSGAMLYFDEVQAGINEPNPLDAVKKSGKLGDISREIIQNSPFGEESLFAPVAYIVEKKWIYGIVSSNNGNELIQKYKEYDKTLEESYGYGDNEKDFIIYIETKGRLNFNNVVFIKMSKAMRNYIATLKDRNALYEKFSKEIVSQLDRNNDYAKPFVSEQNLINAFVVEMEYREIKSFDIDNSNHTPSEFLSKVFNHLSDTIRGFKISEEYWNPQLKSDKYLMTPLLLPSLNTEKATRALYIVSLLPNSHKNKVLPLINIAIQFAKAIDSVYTILKETSEKSKLLFAFYCGVINGTLEFLTGIIDMLLIIIELLLKTELNTSVENILLLESLIEIFENLGEEFLKNPNFLGEAIKKAVSDYFDKRYDRSNFSYVVAHNMGEDLILTVDIIISIVSVVKGLAGLARRAPKFVNWIDDAIKRNGKGSRLLQEKLLEKKYGKIYRVQGGDEAPNISKFRFSIKNNKVIIEGDDMIHVTFDDEFRVAQFWTKRGNKAEVFTAEIDSKFIEKIKQDAISQEYAKAFPNRPQIDDPTKTKNSYGIPKDYFDELIESLKNPTIIKYE